MRVLLCVWQHSKHIGMTVFTKDVLFCIVKPTNHIWRITQKEISQCFSDQKRLLQCVLNAWLPCCVIVGYDGGRTTLHKNILAPCKYHSICFLECSDLQEWSHTRFNEENHNEEERFNTATGEVFNILGDYNLGLRNLLGWRRWNGYETRVRFSSGLV